MTDKFEPHPFADLFPMIEGDEWEAFKKDIAANGVLHKVVLYDDKILDGRNRYKATEELGVDCPFELYTGTDPLGYVVSNNLRHRHLNDTQRASIAAEIANLPVGANQHTVKEGKQVCAPSVKKAAKIMNVTPRAVTSAKKIKQEATPEVVKEVKAGRMSQCAALKTIRPKDDEPDNANAALPKPTKKQVEVRRTKEYRELEAKHSKLLVEVGFLKEENRKLKEENKKLKQLRRLYDSMVADHKYLEHEHRRVIDENLSLKREIEKTSIK